MDDKIQKDQKVKAGYPSSLDKYSKTKFLGRGSYGYVILSTVGEGEFKDKEVAIKILDLDFYDTDNWENIEKELNIMKQLNHKNLLNSLHTFIKKSDLCLVMPYLEKGSCADILRKEFPKGFDDEALLATILKEALQGLQYLHNDGRIHRDVKAGNILVSSNGEVRLSDYGVSSCLVESGMNKGSARTFTGTPCWMAPEVIKQTKGYDYKADIWSFGITALELAFGKAPYADMTAMKILVKTIQKQPPSVQTYGDRAKKCSRYFKNVVEVCLKEDASRRPNAREILKMRFFKKAKDSEYVRSCLYKDTKEQRAEQTEPFVVSEAPTSNIKAVPVKNFTYEITVGDVEEEKEDTEKGNRGLSKVNGSSSKEHLLKSRESRQNGRKIVREKSRFEVEIEDDSE